MLETAPQLTRRACLALAMLPLTGAAAWADAKSDTLLKKARARAAALRTLEADGTLKLTQPGSPPMELKVSLRLMKPNMGRIVLTSPQITQELRSDGNSLYLVMPQEKEYQRMDAAADGSQLAGNGASPIAAFFKPAEIGKGGVGRYLGKKKIGTRTLDLVQVTDAGVKTTYYLAPDGLVEGTETRITQGDAVTVQSFWLKAPRVNAVLRAADFAYKPPAGFSKPRGPEEGLLAVGALAPDFLLPQPGGQGDLALQQLLKEKKAVLVNFWFAGCPPCREEHPRLQKIYDELKSRGLGIVAVNAFDTDEVVTRYLKERNLNFPVVLGGPDEKYTLGKAYGVTAYPTNYLLGPDGKVLWRGVGFDETTMRKALADAGIR